MDETTKLILKNVAASILRAALYALGTWLVSKGFLDTDTNSALQSHSSEIVAGLITFGITLGWSLWQKYHANKKIDAALIASPDTTRERFEQVHDKIIEAIDNAGK